MENFRSPARPHAILEAPFVPSDVVDRFIGAKAHGAMDVRKLRERWRQEVGLSAPMRLSLGRRGTVSFVMVPVFVLVQTARRWDDGFARTLGQLYLTHGLARLLRTGAYAAALEHLREGVRTALVGAATDDLPAFIARVICQLMQTDGAIRALAEQLTQVSEDVVSDNRAVSRMQGELVRFEGGARESGEGLALVTVTEGESKRLMTLPALLLRSAGVCQEGELFIRTLLRFSPDNEATIITPAARATNDTQAASIESLLCAAESPLPRPGR